MILTVTLNPAIDVTYHVASLVPGETHRVARVDERLGGKGINVASVLAQLGVPAQSTGLLRDGPPLFAPIAAPPRRTVVVADGREATGFWEPGPSVTPEEWADFVDHYATLLSDARVVVFAGSLPTGLPDHAYASLIGLARHAGCATILDTSGPALRLGLLANPDIIKPNAAEFAELDGRGPASGPTTVVQSLGAQGLRACGLHARPPYAVAGNPTGAGDACVAALARGLLLKTQWPDLIRDAAALSAAAVATPVAGQVDLDLYHKLLPDIVVEES
ncbi:sugar kinase [Rhizocola hellebori]|uniref:Sugar kinase n=1 Tax=Rhizocola hellebori TaxID=1392758 RepID=A0A8J3QKK0_9ACTN|nr:PfkB family carbohydrate kinase [Rhizocola hellebori]GIH11479.1 sugar kinase [Rhizocola hellebori]